jgi:hypothetical protein
MSVSRCVVVSTVGWWSSGGFGVTPYGVVSWLVRPLLVYGLYRGI